ncbi:CCA tRNA nucleotidyltransferase [Chenggangzhangella methanolivorans]|uniref:CCA tRNA nucleotidyltransferase n=1 Tax=Chenggangzhangella methanolivorans TaxID=1437009 RepID=A0A9E6UIX3_9HYPH|nr:CCA tRNA nucleotidyltransferase [Chenggangzhangella methanolivorans]QZO01338.1 CCA tRNA nucleotidyltransferase [Chenggangzhangella methanolivorans]
MRDALLGIELGDVDVAATALPEETTRRAMAAGWKVVPTGLEHGTVTVVISGKPFEVTTLRRDVETDGRRATVAFTRDWAEDAARRDLTINGLFLSRDGVVHDHVGGLADLAARRVRFIGDARQRIREDYLRTLRFFRFHARFAEGPPDAEGLAAAIAERDGLSLLSAERVRAELLKLLAARGASETVAEMAGAGLLTPLVGGVPRTAHFARFVDADREAPDALLRLAALSQFVSEDALRLKERLRLSNAESRRLEAIGDMTPRLDPADEPAAKRALYRLGPQAYRDRARLTALGGGDWNAAIALSDRWRAPKFPIAADDFKALGLEGRALGRALKHAEEAWVEAGFPTGRAEIEALIEQASSRPERSAEPDRLPKKAKSRLGQAETPSAASARAIQSLRRGNGARSKPPSWASRV